MSEDPTVLSVVGGIGVFHFAEAKHRLRLWLTRQPPLRGGRRSPNSFFNKKFREYCTL